MASRCETICQHNRQAELSLNGLDDDVMRAQAARLISFGARAGLVAHITGLPKSFVRSLYYKINGRASPAGLSPFTETWYIQNPQRLLHTNIVWKLDRLQAPCEQEPAQRLANLYQAYLWAVKEPVLSIHRVHFVPQLLAIEAWSSRRCEACGASYICAANDLDLACPACKIKATHRCQGCDGVLKQTGVGRRLQYCVACRGN